MIPSSDSNAYNEPQQRQQQRGTGSKVMKVLSYTIIGRIITALMKPSGEKDVEMQRQEHHLQK